jgi:outer membrane protein assembly factor BamB
MMGLRILALVVVLSGVLACDAAAQGTKVWTVSRYDEMERGTTDGVAIRSDGRIEAGPTGSPLYETGGNYVWSVAVDAEGNAYVGMGGTAAGGAVVMRVPPQRANSPGTPVVAPDGKATKVFEGKELGVQAMRVGADERVYAATSPDGKLYRLGATPGDATVVFDAAMTEEKPKYLWDVVQAAGGSRGKGGDIYVAAGAPAVVYRVPAGGGKAEVVFKTVDQHIRCLLMAGDGTLWAGSDGSGVIYKFDTRVAGAKPFAVFAAAKKEITALAMDGAGNVYAAGVGTRPAPGAQSPGLPPLAVTGAVGVTISFSQPGSANAATANTLIPEGSEIYRIGADGSPAKLLSLKDDVVYALAFHDGSLLAATGNRGRLYRVDTAVAGQFTDVAHLEASQGMAFASGAGGGLIVATSNSGKVFRLEDKAPANATYASEVFDAQAFSQWGRVELLPETASGFDLYVRSGNVESPLMGWSDWAPVSKQGAVTVPGGRFAQWKAVLRVGGSVQSVGLNYLQKNLAPVVDEVVVQPGARVAANPPQPPNQTVQVSFPAAAGANLQAFVADSNGQPLTAQKDRTAVTVRWAAHDDNGDDLMFAVWYRGVGERNWRLLKDKISDKFLSFDSALLPDGSYEVKVVASDAPVHTDAETLTGERVSGEFVVDTTPPVPGVLTATLVPGAAAIQKIHATFEAKDATSPIAHAEYSVDAGPWQYLEPVGRVSDSLEERYDFVAAVPAADATNPVTDAREHVLAVRVYDRYENVVAVKAVVR